MKVKHFKGTNIVLKFGVFMAFVGAFLSVPQLIKAYPKMSEGVRLTDGRLITTENKGVYLLDGGVKRPIPSPQVFKSHNFKFSNVQRIAKKDFEAIDNGDALPLQSGTIAVSKADQKAYLIENGKKRYITGPDVVQKSLYSFEEAVMVKEEVLNQHPDGKDYTNHYYVANGTPIFAEGTGVYMVEHNRKRPIPNRVTYESWFTWDEIKEVSSEKMKELPTGDPIMPRDGTLIADDKTVYLFENGEKRAFTSRNEFTNFGYEFGDVKSVSSDFIQNISEGKNIQGVIQNREYLTSTIPPQPISDSFIIQDTSEETIKSFNKEKGKFEWSYKQSEGIQIVKHAQEKNYIFTTSKPENSKVKAVNKDTGDVVWSTTHPPAIREMVVGKQDSGIYTLNSQRVLRKLTVRQGNTVWKKSFKKQGTIADIISQPHLKRVIIKVYQNGKESLWGVNTKNGKVEWKREKENSSSTEKITIGPERKFLYLGSGQGRPVKKINIMNGTTVWSNKPFDDGKKLDPIQISPNGQVLIGHIKDGFDMTGDIIGLDVDTGELLWKKDDLLNKDLLLGKVSFAFDQEGKRVFISPSYNDQRLYALNIASGAILWKKKRLWSKKNNLTAIGMSEAFGTSKLVQNGVIHTVGFKSQQGSRYSVRNVENGQFIVKQYSTKTGKLLQKIKGPYIDKSGLSDHLSVAAAGLINQDANNPYAYWKTAVKNSNNEFKLGLKKITQTPNANVSGWKTSVLAKDVPVAPIISSPHPNATGYSTKW